MWRSALHVQAAFGQLRLYALALENPPLLIVSDMLRFRIRTNWTNSVSKTHAIELDDLTDAAARNKLKWAFSDPERLRPGETRQSLTEQAAESFAMVAQNVAGARSRPARGRALRQPARLLHVCRRVGLLPNHMFTRMLEQARRTPAHFADLAGDLFRVMASGGRVGFETVDWFNGGLFDDDAVVPLERSDIDWSDIDPSILGTLFERGLDPDKRAQLGAHYTRSRQDHADRRASGDPSVAGRVGGGEGRDRRGDRTGGGRQVTCRSYEAAERGLSGGTGRSSIVCEGSRYSTPRVARATSSTSFCRRSRIWSTGCSSRRKRSAFPRQFSCIVGPANVKGIEINPYAAELARVSVWIGEIQWMRRNGYSEGHDPILKPLDTIVCRNAILTPDDTEPNWPEADVADQRASAATNPCRIALSATERGTVLPTLRAPR